MNIDMEMIEAIVAAGATGAVVLAFLKLSQHRTQRAQPATIDRLPKDTDGVEHETPKPQKRRRQRKLPDVQEIHVAEANVAQAVDDTPRARLFREGTPNLIALGVKDQTARQLIGRWLKITHDDCQLVTATINKAFELQVADPAPWIMASLKGKTGGQNGNRNSVMDAADNLISRIESFEIQGGDRIIDITPGRL